MKPNPIIFITGLLTAALLSAGAGTASAQTREPDGSMIVGDIRLYDRLPPPDRQNPRCRDAARNLLGGLAMGFYGVGPWISNRPDLERNCTTLLDIPPLGQIREVGEMRAAPRAMWSRVVRVHIPRNIHGYGEGLAIGWCETADCRINALVLFDETTLLGLCRTTAVNGFRAEYYLNDTRNEIVLSAATNHKSCVHEPQAAVAALVTTERFPDVTRRTYAEASGRPASRVGGDTAAPSHTPRREEFMRRYEPAPPAPPAPSIPPISDFYGERHGN